ncbi:hypothetical protein [Paenibacillus peoriae]|uniref:hypothetical protein n=1 Tax=Paenibacillus peoriae TaxID=59893 RepID=UPI00096D4A9A|nr:hypothetical protein [Paenibacillus peoriae]OMF43536.1 hypothetical protein BK135_17950 [Paenibacillus peoriae]
MLNPREQAILIWFGVFIIYVLSVKGVRASIPQILKSFFGLFRHPIFILTNLYILFIFCVMFFFRILEVGVVKDYLVWIFSALYPLIFRVSSKYKEININKIFKDTFKLSVVPLFVINEYTLSLVAELVVVPILALIAGILAVTKRDEKYVQARKLLNNILMIFGFIFICTALRGLILHLNDTLEVDFWMKMFIDIIGIVLHIPLLYFLKYVGFYEQIITRTKIDKLKKIHAMVIIFLNYRFKTEKLLECSKNYKLWSINNINELRDFLKFES